VVVIVVAIGGGYSQVDVIRYGIVPDDVVVDICIIGA
jgi:hypothetical protein